MDKIIELMINNGTCIAMLIYFVMRDYKLTDKLENTLSRVEKLLDKIENKGE